MNTSSVRKLCRVVAAATCCAVLFGCSPEPTRKSSGPSTSADTTTSPGAPASNDLGGGASPGGGKSSPVGMSRTGAPQRASERTPKRPNATPPARPAAMSQVSPQGAVAAAEHYLNLTAYAAATGDYSDLEAMSGGECRFCKAFIGKAKKLSEEGWVVKTGVPSVTIEKSRQWDTGKKSTYQIDVIATKGEYTLVAGRKRKKIIQAERSAFGFVLSYGKDWIVEDAEAVDPARWNETVDKS